MAVFQAKAPTENRCKAKHFLNDILCVRGDAGECVSRALINKIDLGLETAKTDQTPGVSRLSRLLVRVLLASPGHVRE